MQVYNTFEGKACWWGNQTTYIGPYTVVLSNEIIKSCYKSSISGIGQRQSEMDFSISNLATTSVKQFVLSRAQKETVN